MSKYLVPYADSFLEAAAKVGQTTAMETLLAYQQAKEPKSTKRYAAIFEIGQHASQKRFYLFDGKTGTVKQLHAAHGSGSEGDKNDGFATVFSNTPDSRCSSLGLYKCGETYIGKHGRSLRLDGLEKSNSNARKRAIVMHGADYVREVSGAESGDSWGCPALSNKEVQSVIDCLVSGSLLLIYKKGK